MNPGTAGQYTRFMARKFDERRIIAVHTGFMAFFGRLATGSMSVFSKNASVVDIDIIRGNRKVAALIHRGQESRPLGGQKDTQTQNSTAFGRVFPLIEETGNISSAQLEKRLAGENPYAPMSRVQRQRELAFEHHEEHIRRIIRRMAVMATESVLTGQMSAIDATTNTDLIYDFYRNAALTITVGTPWSNVAAPAMTDIDDACDLINEHGHTIPDGMVLGGSAMDEFLSNTEIIAKADNRRFELIAVSTNNPVPDKFKYMLDAGFIARGRLRTARGYELWMFTFLDKYVNDAGTSTNYMPDGKVLIFDSGARADRYFGPPDRLEPTAQEQAFMREFMGFGPSLGEMPMGAGGVITPEMFYFDAEKTSNKTASIITQGAPIFATTQTDAYAVLTV